MDKVNKETSELFEMITDMVWRSTGIVSTIAIILIACPFWAHFRRMRLCFDKGDKWCENEGNALNLIFVHDMYIPTDTEQAVMFALTSEHRVDLRVNFLLNEPAVDGEEMTPLFYKPDFDSLKTGCVHRCNRVHFGPPSFARQGQAHGDWCHRKIQFEYAFSMPNIPGISHTMYLKSYAEVDLDPTKLKIHVVKGRFCQARLVNDFGDIHLGFDNEQQSQCINIKSCTCYDYDESSDE